MEFEGFALLYFLLDIFFNFKFFHWTNLTFIILKVLIKIKLKNV